MCRNTVNFSRVIQQQKKKPMLCSLTGLLDSSATPKESRKELLRKVVLSTGTCILLAGYIVAIIIVNDYAIDTGDFKLFWILFVVMALVFSVCESTLIFAANQLRQPQNNNVSLEEKSEN